jgi:rod shape determining protein RodA
MAGGTTSQAVPMRVSQRLLRVNWLLLALVALIGSVGVATLYSVAGGTLEPWADRHAIRLMAGIGIVLAIAATPMSFWVSLAWPAYAVAFVALALVPLAGTEVLGARRWLRFAGFSVQPSELMKVALIVALARYYDWLPPERVSRPLWVALPLAAIAVPVVLVLKQPDLGTATLFAAVGLGLMFLAGVRLLYFVAGGVAAIGLAPFVWAGLHDYQRRRIVTFLDPEHDPLGAGYHIIQSRIALGSGGVVGKGYMQGTQGQLDFLPEKQTDFIFTMLGEEMGFVGTMSLIALYALTIGVLIAMAVVCRNQFSRLLVAGAALVVFIYSAVNISMVMGLVPVVGVPLPLVSYGGTAMTTVMITLGLAMCGYVHRSARARKV